jgi:cyclomaltodextrin glucanotransferase
MKKIHQKCPVPRIGFGLAALTLAICGQPFANEFYGTTEAFAEEAIYFVMTDRFVDGDTSNNQFDQGNDVGQGTWDRSMPCSDGSAANIGYQGGDFAGIYNNADYIAEMGFTSVWITPVVDNPDEAFTGGSPLECGAGVGADKGKTGYHGYWGVNFYQVDEHLESPGLSFREFNSKMEGEFGLKTVLDIVGNHGSPSYTMTESQAKFGKIYDQNGNLKADHMNRQPSDLSDDESLHDWYNRGGGLAQLSDLDDEDPEVMDYLVNAYLQWIDQGADAFRIDTIAWMPHAFWKEFSDRIRAENPDFYMFGENFNYNAGAIAQHQKPENGGISVLDFPGQRAITQLFQNSSSDYADIQWYLHLDDGQYTNPYVLASFYDNHDMSRMNSNGNENVFVDANNWLFTARGIPVVYYGSEMQFMQGKSEHAGNRNYYGQDNINAARNGRIYQELSAIAQIRKTSVALQKGLQVNGEFAGQKAAFFRVFEQADQVQTALVLLNKGDATASFSVSQYLSPGDWVDAASGEVHSVTDSLATTVEAHGVKVLILNAETTDAELINVLMDRMNPKEKVVVTPENLLAGESVTVSYRSGANKELLLHWGINNWSDSGTSMGDEALVYNAETFAYEGTLTLPADASQFDFVFNNTTDGSWDTNGGSDWHVSVEPRPVELPPSTPINAVAIAGNGQAIVRWDATANTDEYRVYYTDDGLEPSLLSEQATVTDSSFTHTGLTNGTTYSYRVLASNEYGDSALGTTSQATPGESFATNLGQGATLHLTGTAFAAWDPANTTYQLQMVADHRWQTRVTLPTALTNSPYKLTLNGTWAVNWGGNASGLAASLNRSGGDASATLSAGDYLLSVDEGSSAEDGLSLSWRAQGDPVLAVNPMVLDLGDLVVNSQTDSEVLLTNAGAGSLSVSDVSEPATWMTATLDDLRITVAIDTTELIVGMSYSDFIVVESNGGDAFVEVRFTVVAAPVGVTVTLSCTNGHTKMGQSVYAVGNVAELGQWNVADAIALESTTYPTWTGTVTLPAATAIAWKCIKRDETQPAKDLVWEGGTDTLLTTPSTGTDSSAGAF